MPNHPNDSAIPANDPHQVAPLSRLSPSTIVILLSAMMFLQFFAWGSWFATLSAAMDTHLLGAFIGAAYEAAPIAAIFAPLFLGLVADRFFASEKVMGGLMLLGGVIMLFIPGLAESASAFAAQSAAEMRASGSYDAQAFLEMQAAENTAGKTLQIPAVQRGICCQNNHTGTIYIIQ